MMQRRSFLASILALGAAPAIVRASSLMGFGTEPEIVLPVAQEIVIAHAIPTPDQARKMWPGADLHAMDDIARYPDEQYLCIRDDGCLVMGSDSIVAYSMGAPYPLKRWDGDIAQYFEPVRKPKPYRNWLAV